MVPDANFFPDQQAELLRRFGEGDGQRFADAVRALRGLGVRDGVITHGLERLVRGTGGDLFAILREEGLISGELEAQATAALRHGARFFDATIVDALPVEAIATACGVVGIDLSRPPEIPYAPVALSDEQGLSGRRTITVIIARDGARALVSSLFAEHFDVEIGYASERTVRSVYQTCFAQTEARLVNSAAEFERRLQGSGGGEGITALLIDILRHAAYSGASDIALKPVGRIGTLSMKVGGIWKRVLELSQGAYDRAIRALESACEGNDGEERRIFRDTAFSRVQGAVADALRADLKTYQFRVVLGAAAGGRTVTIRVLDEDVEVLELSRIGIEPSDYRNLKLIAGRRSGMFIVVGPTGSGKTTFVHAFLRQLIDAVGSYVQTAERPVEYRIPNASQYPLDVSLDEAAALEQVRQGLMRNAPNVILLGEVRTADAAKYAQDLSATGHLLITTMHADSAPMGVRRLLDMGLEPADLAAQLLGVMAMRLVDRLCPDCRIIEDREDYSAWAGRARSAGIERLYRHKAAGCANCGYRGYRGRFAIYELMVNSSAVRQAVNESAAESELRRAGVPVGRSLLDCAQAALYRGDTGVEDVLRAMPASLGWGGQ